MKELLIKKHIGRKILEYRLEKGLSQAELSLLIGKETGTSISYYENGLRGVSIVDLINLSKALDRTVNDFIPI